MPWQKYQPNLFFNLVFLVNDVTKNVNEDLVPSTPNYETFKSTIILKYFVWEKFVSGKTLKMAFSTLSNDIQSLQYIFKKVLATSPL